MIKRKMPTPGTPQMPHFGISADKVRDRIVELQDKATYDSLVSQLEHNLRQDSRIDWHVDRWDERLGDACISDATAKERGTTPEDHEKRAYKQMVIWLKVLIGTESLRIKMYVARALVEDAIDPVDIIKQLAAEQIPLMLIEKGIV